MKEKILMLIIGILIGAIITAGIFMLVGNNKKPDMKNGDFRGERMGNMIEQEGMPMEPKGAASTSENVM